MGIMDRVDNWICDDNNNVLFVRFVIVSIVALILLICTMMAISIPLNIMFNEGYEVTKTGTVSVITWDHNKLFNFDHTYVELLTFSGAEYGVKLLGHVELEFGTTYTIVYKRVSPLSHHVFLYGEVVSITPVNVTKTWAWYPP